jgi:predicted GIY-YIG superfamily endonuclease
VYSISCECGKVYIGQTGRSVDTRLKEHQRHIRLEHPDKSAMAEHNIDLGHRIQFHNTSDLASETQYMDHIVREAIEIEFHRNNINREVRFCLSKSWKPLICSLKKPDAISTRPHRPMHNRQSSPETTGSIPIR